MFIIKKLARQGSLEIQCEGKAVKWSEQIHHEKVFLRQWGEIEYWLNFKY